MKRKNPETTLHLSRLPFLVLTLFVITMNLSAQVKDSLPQFKVTNFGPQRTLVNWVNGYPSVKQISIQRSNDSLRNFTTILTVPDPLNRENGYLDTKAPKDNMFYRLFIVIDGANFVFSKSQRPFFDTTRPVAPAVSQTETPKLVIPLTEKAPDSVIVMVLDTLTDQYIPKKIKNDKALVLADSINKLQAPGLKSNNKPNVFVPSMRLFTNAEGYLRISLEDFDKKKYSIKFYEDNDNFLFEIKEVKRPYLVLDKTNFFHAGWFKFELFENGKILEKHRFFISK
ncbi:MAG: hypothetical protein JNN29_10100 [Chitinophagaceae bacterium]|nr:hypothetical protein [Chitinophagaceae bacterium]